MEDPVARAELLLSEAKQTAEMRSSAKGFSADAGGADASGSSKGMAGGSQVATTRVLWSSETTRETGHRREDSMVRTCGRQRQRVRQDTRPF